MGWQPETLTTQIDGVKTVFTTTFQRISTQIMVFFNGSRVPDDEFTEPSQTQVALLFAPTSGDELFVFYDTDQTVDGRVLGFAEDPTSPPTPFPTGLEELLEDIDNRLDILESGIAGTLLSGTDGNVLTEVQPGFYTAFEPIPSGGASFNRASFTPTSGQTVFTLPTNIGDNDSVLFIVNTVTYKLGTDFTVTGAAEVTWQDNEFTLDALDCVEVVYLEA